MSLKPQTEHRKRRASLARSSSLQGSGSRSQLELKVSWPGAPVRPVLTRFGKVGREWAEWVLFHKHFCSWNLFKVVEASKPGPGATILWGFELGSSRAGPALGPVPQPPLAERTSFGPVERTLERSGAWPKLHMIWCVRLLESRLTGFNWSCIRDQLFNFTKHAGSSGSIFQSFL